MSITYNRMDTPASVDNDVDVTVSCASSAAIALNMLVKRKYVVVCHV